MTGKSTQEDKIKGFKIGAVYFIYKPCSIEEIREIAHSLISSYELNRKREKERTIKGLGTLLDEIRETDNSYVSFDSMCDKLKITTREKEVLQLIIKGKDHPDIAKELYISIKTVRTHVNRLYHKCDAKRRSELIDTFKS